MVLDLNRILLYGRIDGSLSDVPQRNIYSLTDGIIAGEGEGPLAPSPIVLGAVSFSSSSPYADLVHCALMRLAWQKIPLVRQSYANNYRYSVKRNDPGDCQIPLKDSSFSGHQYEDFAFEFGLEFRARV